MIDLQNLNIHAIIDEAGIRAPTYPEILEELKNTFKRIYCQDIYIEPESKDGELLAIFAKAIHDTNNSAIKIYHSFSPSRATGDALTSNVKINGISRKSASFSQCDVVITGTKGTIIKNGSVRDRNNVLWDLPEKVIIGLTESITVTVKCREIGAVIALPHSITEIATPTKGWLSVDNLNMASIGQPIETDAELRKRQSLSVALPSQTVLNGITGAIANIEGVIRYRVYENDSNKVDRNGLPPHSISVIVDGGDAQEIGKTIALKKTPGAGTFGTTKVKYIDDYGLENMINFFRPTIVHIYVVVNIKIFEGYNNSIGDQIKKEILNYINNVPIGNNLLCTKLYTPADVPNNNKTIYDIKNIMIGTNERNLSTSNIIINFNELMHCKIDYISLGII